MESCIAPKTIVGLVKVTFDKNQWHLEKKNFCNGVGAFSGRIGLPPAVMGWAASCDDGP